MDKICGCIVLRKPSENCDAESKPPFFFRPRAPQINGVYYSGIDRAAWFELDEACLSKTASDDLIEFRKQLRAENKPNLDILVTKQIDKAMDVLRFSNKKQNRYELAVVYSSRLDKQKGHIQTNEKIEWLGIEPYCYGYGSPLKEGIFKLPNLFQGYTEKLNSNGLFESIDEFLADYLASYDLLSRDDSLENFPHVDSLNDRLRIGRMLLG